MTKIFAIYPTDKQYSTKFLNKIHTYLTTQLAGNWHCYKVKFTDNDHSNCIKIACSNTKFILFMGHGRSDALFGSCAAESNDFISPDAVEFNKDFYKNDTFITSNNIHQFKDKIFFSFSCKSNQNNKNSIGRNAIVNDVTTFIGFGDIPTDYVSNVDFSKKAIALFKHFITKIIKQSLFLAIKDNYCVQDLIDLIKILTNKEIQELILSKNRHKNSVIYHLYSFKDDIKIFGDKFAKLG